jgi:hypothetical protein
MQLWHVTVHSVHGAPRQHIVTHLNTSHPSVWRVNTAAVLLQALHCWQQGEGPALLPGVISRASTPGPSTVVPVPGLLGLMAVPLLKVTGLPGPGVPISTPLYTRPLPVYVMGVAVAGVGWSHLISSDPAVLPGTTRQYMPVATDCTMVLVPGSTGAVLEPVAGVSTNCSAGLLPVAVALVNMDVLVLVTDR